MNALVNFLSHTSAELQIIIFTAMLLICWNIENIAGLAMNYNRWKHTFLNAKFILTNTPVQFLLGFVFVYTMQWTKSHHFGFLQYLPFAKNQLALFLATFVFLDFGEYIYHVLMHKIKRLWMFHVVHHSDLAVDVSTTLREHPGENLIRNSFTLIWIFISGTFFWVLVLRQLIQVSSNIFSHIHYRLPEKLDRLVGWIFITPNLHHVHHHYKQPYTDCNYGDVLSIWDRMFGTFSRLSASKIIFGVDTYMTESENSRYGSLIKMPFGKYRKHKKCITELIPK